MSEKRRTYSGEFKLETVRLWDRSDKSAADIERELGIGDGCLSRWRKKLSIEGEGAFPGHGRLAPEQDELRQLKRELEIVRQERDTRMTARWRTRNS